MNDIIYSSTRGAAEKLTASQAILKGLASDGGLFVPDHIPALDKSLEELSRMDYAQVAYEVMKLFLTDYTEDELKACIKAAYDEKFDTEEIAPLAEAADAYFLELYHGATIAFKDMALSILPHLMTTAARKNNVNNEIVILTATSGDTGKAALAGFASVPGTKIIVFYPKDGVSPIQKQQMVTQKGDNTFVVGINGNFDNAQSGVKALFANEELASWMSENKMQFSSANSINIGRLVPQIVYYVYAYTRLLKEERIRDKEYINVTVPTGNFGNILAAYYAKLMGLPIAKLICASNENKVLYDFFKSGTYDRNREFILTSSPSMDILISSNLERLIYHICSNDPNKCRSLMELLSRTGRYDISDEMQQKLEMFEGGFCDEDTTLKTIAGIYKSCGYLIDTHTAVAAGVYKSYRNRTGDQTPTVIASTASPYKFTGSVLRAIDPGYVSDDDFDKADRLFELSGVPIPSAVTDIRTAPILHKTICEVDEMEAVVRDFLSK
ncbi:MAG: threonine synthase [Lachnospiraceae bacterium]|nr:threonine synthase [Lachnospiraceae bacterium]